MRFSTLPLMVAALLSAEKKPGEDAATCLRRLGPVVEQTFRQA